MQTITIAIIGATGYTGSELVRLLTMHPNAHIQAITSETYKGQPFSAVHPQFTGVVDLPLVGIDDAIALQPDLVFLALPHGVSMEYVEKLKSESCKIVDLSGDFRLSTPEVYADWYGKEHTFPEGFEKAAYGMPELHGEAISKTTLVANPGCFPTTAILGVAPLLDAGLIDPVHIIVDAKSGTTGAGAKAKEATHFSNVNENFKAYKLKNHRHTVEIEEQLSAVCGKPVKAQFTPHLLPIDRGILSTIYTQALQTVTDAQLKEVYADFYKNAPFVRLRENPPSLKDVRSSNFCDLFVTYDERTNRIITLSAIDNLVKGAAGAAVQNMNRMFGLADNTGFFAPPLRP